MKATSFLNEKRIVVVRVSDSTFHFLSETETERWISDFLHYIAGAGHPVRHLKDGEFRDGDFTNSVRTYKTYPYQEGRTQGEAGRKPPVEEPLRFEFAVDVLLDVQQKLRHRNFPDDPMADTEADCEAKIADIEDTVNNLYAIREVCPHRET